MTSNSTPSNAPGFFVCTCGDCESHEDDRVAAIGKALQLLVQACAPDPETLECPAFVAHEAAQVARVLQTVNHYLPEIVEKLTQDAVESLEKARANLASDETQTPAQQTPNVPAVRRTNGNGESRPFGFQR